MIIRLPTAEDLQRIAEDNYFELSDEELAEFQSLIPGLFANYEQLERMPLPHRPLKYRDRDPGYRPSREEDPFNAIVRRCSLRGSGSGKLAGKRIGLKNNVCVSGMPLAMWVVGAGGLRGRYGRYHRNPVAGRWRRHSRDPKHGELRLLGWR